MGFPFSGAFTDATVFGDGAGVRFVRPVALVDLYTENGAVQVLAAWAVELLSTHGGISALDLLVLLPTSRGIFVLYGHSLWGIG